jgi:hypothetical protein
MARKIYASTTCPYCSREVDVTVKTSENVRSKVVQCDNMGCGKDFMIRYHAKVIVDIQAGEIPDKMQSRTDEQRGFGRSFFAVPESPFVSLDPAHGLNLGHLLVGKPSDNRLDVGKAEFTPDSDWPKKFARRNRGASASELFEREREWASQWQVSSWRRLWRDAGYSTTEMLKRMAADDTPMPGPVRLRDLKRLMSESGGCDRVSDPADCADRDARSRARVHDRLARSYQECMTLMQSPDAKEKLAAVLKNAMANAGVTDKSFLSGGQKTDVDGTDDPGDQQAAEDEPRKGPADDASKGGANPFTKQWTPAAFLDDGTGD